MAQLQKQYKKNYRLLAGKALRDFIYTQVGYDPSYTIPDVWRQFHDRVSLTYNSVPKGYFGIFKEMSDITPPEIYLIENLKDQLISLGYDEILSWPLVDIPTDKNTVITTQNSINSEAIYLRQSLIPSLVQQLDQYNRFKLPQPQFFEIGKA